MNIDELRGMMKVDSFINENELASEAVNTHSLYNKYQSILYDLTIQIIQVTEELNKKKLFLYEYWLGKCDDDVYINKPKNQKVLKGDVDMYIKSDDEYNIINTKLQKLELLAKMVDDFMKQISNRNYAIKNAIEYKKFENGGY